MPVLRILAAFSMGSSSRGLPRCQSSIRFSTSSTAASRISIKNSLSGGSTVLLPSELRSALTWYSCGPTVYDAAHIGHARTYVCTDIIRRILTKHFQVSVDFALGMTDIDDKIINRSIEQGHTEWASMVALARRYEREFFEDMDALGVLRPDAVLRVTEHVDEIVKYIDGIKSAGHAYQTDDGVYFDIEAFSRKEHRYGKLGNHNAASSDSPEGEKDAVVNAEEVHARSSSNPTLVGQNSKRDKRDFALWKRSKGPLDPSWSSPWGRGRPGWHIECSAMTQAYFGPKLDIHSGGIDLKFPHHTNEIAQCESHNRSNDWVRFWLHTGHLYIEGAKMSKSLKNFISIREYLQRDNFSEQPALDFRVFCLLHRYHAAVHFDRAKIADAAEVRKRISGFCQFVEQIERRANMAMEGDTASRCHRKPCSSSKELTGLLLRCQEEVNVALANDFDTPEALRSALFLIQMSMYYATRLAAAQARLATAGAVAVDNNTDEWLPVEPLTSARTYVLHLMALFGIDVQVLQSQHDDSAGNNEKEMRQDTVQAMVDFRSRVRASGLQCMKDIKKLDKLTDNEEAKAVVNAIKKEIGATMAACDKLRDDTAPRLNIQIDDIANASSVWKPLV